MALFLVESNSRFNKSYARRNNKKLDKSISNFFLISIDHELNVKSTLDINKINELIKSTKHHIRFAKSPSGIDAKKLLISNHRASSNLIDCF